MTTKRMTSTLIVMCLAALSPFVRAAELALSWYTIDGGGGYCAGGDFQLEGTIGQHDAGAMSGGEFELSGGFWLAAAATPPDTCGPLPGDLDRNGHVDLVDYSTFSSCFSGPGISADPGCECADMDADGDVDLVDFSSFSAAFNG